MPSLVFPVPLDYKLTQVPVIPHTVLSDVSNHS